MNLSLKNNTKYRTCVSVAAKTPRAMISTLRAALKRSDYAELRLDYLKPKDVPRVLELAAPHLNRCVCTLRPKREGGKFTGNEKERDSILRLISEYNPMLLDVELGTLRARPSLRKYISKTGTSVLVSWHDFDKTPGFKVLQRKLDEMSKYSENVKIVTMAKRVYDSAWVLGLYGRAKKVHLVAFCMGNDGRASRVLSMYLGSPFAYVSLSKPIAPGQFSLAQMRRLLPSK